MGGAIAITLPGEDMVAHYAERESLQLDGEQNPPILEAALDGRAALWKAIRRGADVNAKNAYGETALMLGQYDRKTVRKLIEAGAQVDARDRFGVTSLMRAAAAGNRPVARELLASGASVNLADNKGRTALMVAAADGDQKMVQLLVDAGADRSMRDADGKTAKDYFPVSEPESCAVPE
jgi:ankyrin repeat protein